MLLNELKAEQIEKSKAAFVCSLVLYINPYRFFIVQEEVAGEITFNPAGNNGFGYDPIFFLPEQNCTIAQLSAEQKNQLSHRGKAAIRMALLLDSLDSF
jgi:XTP/dITP diphosphohydrolase